MLTHDHIWQSIDRLAREHGYSPSGLAKKAGLDPTAFNRSKRVSGDGKPRWPSTESIAKILAATGATTEHFLGWEAGAEPAAGLSSLQPGAAVAVRGRDGRTVAGMLVERRPGVVVIRVPGAGERDLTFRRADMEWIAVIVGDV